jgi:divalent metal cation (Fe/Co/Zn/Cd) transporter
MGLVIRAVAAISLALVLLVIAGIAVAWVSQAPVKYNEFNSLTVSLIISLAVGIAAALANTDDGGRRELIGLAATAQIAVIPVWLGVGFVLGFPAAATHVDILEKVLALFLNLLIVTAASLVTYLSLNAIGGARPSTKIP